MRTELEAAGVELPDTAELTELARMFYQGLEEARVEWGDKNQGAMSWHNVYKEFDSDGSGVLRSPHMLFVIARIRTERGLCAFCKHHGRRLNVLRAA